MVLIEANAVLIEEVLILQVFLEHHVNHPSHERRIGSGPKGNPFIGQHRCRIRVARIHHDDLEAGLLRHSRGERDAAAGHSRFLWVVSPQHQQLGVLDRILDGVRRLFV